MYAGVIVATLVLIVLGISIMIDKKSISITVKYGEKDIEDINQLERSYAEQCQEYLDSGGNYTAQQWAAYESRITACSLIASDSVVEIDSLYFTSTTTMETSWWRLKELESNVYLRIITGQVSVDFFDKFVQEWENLGGTTISKEVEETINRDK